MAERKSNNTPWIIFGILGGILFLILPFGIGFYGDITSTGEPYLVEPPAPPIKVRDKSELTSTSVIRVDKSGEISTNFGGEISFDDIDNLKLGAPADTKVILYLSDEASHHNLVETKDALDAAGYQTLISIVPEEELQANPATTSQGGGN